jgi:hypothetical protein
MLNRTTSRKFIAPRRQERKERPILISPNLGAPFDLAQGMLCAFARVAVFRALDPKFGPKIANIFG